MKKITQNIQTWMNRNRDWLWLLAGIVTFVLLTDYENASKDFIEGFNDGVKDKDCNCDDNSIGSIIGIALVVLLILWLFWGIIAFLGNFFYHFFFKFILQKNKILNIITFALWLIIFYNLFWDGIHLIIEKNNAFEKKEFSLKEYRNNYTSILTSSIFGFIIIYILVKNFITNTKTQAKLIAQKSQAELMALKAQINPHFLFNVLNNLYGSAIVEDSPKTSEGILQLSSIMRHVVEGTKNERIEVEKEIRFLNDYIELNKMRIPNRPNIRIATEIFWDENPTMIAPLLVIPYIENAFKYGISTTEECFIEMSFRIENQQLKFVCRNSIIKADDKLEVGTGTGLDNTKHRLDLYYPTAHQLRTSSSESVFVVNLEVNL